MRLLVPVFVAAVVLTVGSPGAVVPRGATGPATEVVVTLSSPALAYADSTADVSRRIFREQERFSEVLAAQLPEARLRWRYRIVANGFALLLPQQAIPPPPGAPGRPASRPFDPEQSGHAPPVAGIAAGNNRPAAAGGRSLSGVAPR